MERIETIDLKAETDALEAGHGIIVDDNTDYRRHGVSTPRTDLAQKQKREQ